MLFLSRKSIGGLCSPPHHLAYASQLNDVLVRVFKLLPFILLIILYIGVTSLKCVLNAKVSEKWVLDGGRHLCQLILDCLYIFAVA